MAISTDINDGFFPKSMAIFPTFPPSSPGSPAPGIFPRPPMAAPTEGTPSSPNSTST